MFAPNRLELELELLELPAPPKRPPDPELAEAVNMLAEVTPSMFSLLYILTRTCLMFWSGLFILFLLAEKSSMRVLILVEYWSMVLAALAV